MRDRETFKKRQGYNYYVYVAPGQIEYFERYEDALEYAERYDAQVKEV